MAIATPVTGTTITTVWGTSVKTMVDAQGVEIDALQATAAALTGAGAPAGTGTNGTQYWDTTNKRLYVSDGVGWIIVREPEQSYVPTWTNVTLGSGSTRTGFYQRSNGYVDWSATVIIGTGGAVAGGVTVSLPVAFGLNAGRYSHAVMILDSGTNNYRALNSSNAAGATTMAIYSVNSSGSLENANDFSATSPYTWAVGDSISISGRSKMNTVYL